MKTHDSTGNVTQRRQNTTDEELCEIDSKSFKLSISVTDTIRKESLGQEFRKETFGVCSRLHIFSKKVCSTIRTTNLSSPTDYAVSLGEALSAADLRERGRISDIIMNVDVLCKL